MAEVRGTEMQRGRRLRLGARTWRANVRKSIATSRAETDARSLTSRRLAITSGAEGYRAEGDCLMWLKPKQNCDWLTFLTMNMCTVDALPYPVVAVFLTFAR